jgi:hypothetical protein
MVRRVWSGVVAGPDVTRRLVSVVGHGEGAGRSWYGSALGGAGRYQGLPSLSRVSAAPAHFGPDSESTGVRALLCE